METGRSRCSSNLRVRFNNKTECEALGFVIPTRYSPSSVECAHVPTRRRTERACAPPGFLWRGSVVRPAARPSRLGHRLRRRLDLAFLPGSCRALDPRLSLSLWDMEHSPAG